jgi:hypothetical protein
MALDRIDLMRPLPALSWLVSGLILRGYINIVASLPGEGKTALLTSLAWQAARPAGVFLNRPVASGPTLYVDFDAPGGGRTVRYWLEKHRRAFPDGDVSKVMVLEPDADTYGVSEGEFAQLAEAARDTGAALILLDSFSSAFPSVDPIKLVQVQVPLWHLRRLAFESGAAVVVADHLPKPISGERAGARGVIGSVAKSAQARAVHLLTRLPPGEVQGRYVLRWDTAKLSYAARPAPFGVDVRFTEETVGFEVVPLPATQGETRTERAVRAMQDHLEAQRGTVVKHQALLDIAVQEGDLRSRAAAEALRLVKERFGNELLTAYLPGRGKPQGYRLEPLPTSAPLQRMNGRPSSAVLNSLHKALHQSRSSVTKDDGSTGA